MPLFEVETECHIIITWAGDQDAAADVVQQAYPEERILRMTKRPRTSVWSGSPFTVRPCHGDIFARDWIFASSIVQARPRSTTVMSASAPGTITPFRG